MKELLDSWLRAHGHDPETWSGTAWLEGAALLALGVLLIAFAALVATVLGRVQLQRESGANGARQPDLRARMGWKQALLGPAAVAGDRALFGVGQALTTFALGASLAVLPFGYHLSATRMNTGVLAMLALAAVGCVGELLSSASRSRGRDRVDALERMRSRLTRWAPAAVALGVPVLAAGTLDLHELIRAQGGAPWDWFAFQTPMGAVACGFMLIAMRGHRTAGARSDEAERPERPGDLIEHGALWLQAAVLVSAFLGGWQVPGITNAQLAAWDQQGHVPLGYWLASSGLFLLKVVAVMGTILWLRARTARPSTEPDTAWSRRVALAFAVVLLQGACETLSFAVFGEASQLQAPLLSARGALHLAVLVATASALVAQGIRMQRGAAIPGRGPGPGERG